MASIRRTEAGTWQVYWREPGSGKQVARNLSSQADARSLRAEVEHRMDRGTYVREAARRISLEDYLDGVISSLSWRPQSRQNWALAARKHIVPVIGGYRLCEVTPATVRSFLAELEASEWTKSLCYDILSRAFRTAETEGLVMSPMRAVRRPSPAAPAVQPLAPRVVEALASAITPRYRLVVLLGGFAGLRIGEVGGLHVDDFDGQRLRIHRAALPHDGGVLGPTKTKASRRTIVVPSFLASELGQVEPQPDGRLFATRTGGLVHRQSVGPRWQHACRIVGVDARFHDLRHTCASLLIAAGEQPKVIQHFLGHANIRVTLDVYGHLFEEFAASAAERLDAAWEGRSLRAVI
ncbi:MAG: tyrosine-type recombinase/integrase [Actinomycetota bacterium]